MKNLIRKCTRRLIRAGVLCYVRAREWMKKYIPRVREWMKSNLKDRECIRAEIRHGIEVIRDLAKQITEKAAQKLASLDRKIYLRVGAVTLAMVCLIVLGSLASRKQGSRLAEGETETAGDSIDLADLASFGTAMAQAEEAGGALGEAYLQAAEEAYAQSLEQAEAEAAASAALAEADSDETSSRVSVSEGAYSEFLFVGDSRTVGMQMYCEVEIDAIAKSGMGLDWMETQLDTIYATRGKNIIFNMGVNDMKKINSYIEFYNNLPEDFLAGNKIIIMTVNPADESLTVAHGYYCTNEQITNFNAAIAAGVRDDIAILDSYSYLMTNGFGTSDGVHYDRDTYNVIYRFVVDSVTGQ